MSKINSDFLKKTIHDLLEERKKRKFTEAVELQIGLRDYDPDKRFNGSVKLPNIAHKSVKVLHFSSRFAYWPTQFTSKKLRPKVFPSLMLMDSRLSIKIKPKSKSGLRNTIFSSLLIMLESKSTNSSETFWSRCKDSPST